jgi:hypothetical protein
MLKLISTRSQQKSSGQPYKHGLDSLTPAPKRHLKSQLNNHHMGPIRLHHAPKVGQMRDFLSFRKSTKLPHGITNPPPRWILVATTTALTLIIAQLIHEASDKLDENDSATMKSVQSACSQQPKFSEISPEPSSSTYLYWTDYKNLADQYENITNSIINAAQRDSKWENLAIAYDTLTESTTTLYEMLQAWGQPDNWNTEQREKGTDALSTLQQSSTEIHHECLLIK